LSVLPAEINAYISGTATMKLHLPPTLRFPDLLTEVAMWTDFLNSPEDLIYETERMNQFLSEVRWAISNKISYLYVDVLGEIQSN
jgi:hypothetical protein